MLPFPPGKKTGRSHCKKDLMTMQKATLLLSLLLTTNSSPSAFADHHGATHQTRPLKQLEGVRFETKSGKGEPFRNGFFKAIVAGDHRVFSLKDGRINYLHGGQMTFDGNVWVEKITYHNRPGLRDERTLLFTANVDGDSFNQIGIPGSGGMERLNENWVKIGDANDNIEGLWTRFFENGNRMQKIIVDGFWQWIVINPRSNQVVLARGGTYVYDGRNYTETTEHRLNPEPGWKPGSQWRAKVDLDGDRLVFHVLGQDGKEAGVENWSRLDAQAVRKHYVDSGLATLDDFRKWIALDSGTWEGEVVSTIGENNLGQNTKPYTIRFSGDVVDRPNIMLGQGIGPNGPIHGTTFYDPAGMKIVQLNLGANGTVTESKIIPGDGAWLRTSTYTRPNGQKSHLNSTLKYRDNGNTLTILINGKIGDSVVEKQKNVWKRIR